MTIGLLLAMLLCQSVYPGIKTAKDYNTGDKVIPSGSDVLLLGTSTSVWYELFEGKKSVGFVKQDCVGIQGDHLFLENDCSVYSHPLPVRPVMSFSAGRRFKNFLVSSSSISNIMYSGKKYEVPSEILSFVRPTEMDPESYLPISIEAVVKLKKENVIISPYIDKTMYVSTILGVFTSFDGKKWYRLKKLEPRKHEIAITQEGWLVADTMVSRDFGNSFEEFFPSFALPYKDAYVKGILASPQGINAIYLTFSSRANSGNMTLYTLISPEQGWRKIYPVTEGTPVIIPAEDAMSSILKFINNKWLRNNKYSKKGKIDIEDIELGGSGPSRIVSMMVTTLIDGKKKNYHVSLSLDYSASRGWAISNEKWSFI